MNRLFKYVRPIAFIGTASSVMLIAVSPVAAVSPARTTDASTSSFCTGLPNKASAITNSLNNAKAKVQTAWTNQDTRLTTLATTVDQKVAAARQTADANWQTAFNKLEAKATTANEKAAVQTYQTSVEQAISIRRSAYDTARTNFRDGVKSAIDTRRSTLSDQANTFADSANSALTTAETACSGNTGTAASIRTTLIGSLHAARTTFVDERTGDDKVRTDVQQLAATRDAAFKAADQTFAASLQQADTALKNAFGTNTSSIE